MKRVVVTLTALALACILAPCTGLSGEDEGMNKQVMIDELDAGLAWTSHMGCLISCAKYLKSDASPAWIYGGCGHAFALNIHEQICPSGPTAWAAEKCDRLAANVGLAVEGFSAHKLEEGFADKQEAAWKKVRESIDAGTPCFGWELDVPEWYVICGYDSDGNYLFRNYGGQIGTKQYTSLGDSGIGMLCIDFVKKGKPADDRTTVREAIVFALEHGAGKHSREMYHTGIPGYDTWIKALRNNALFEGDDVNGLGQAYNAQCWAECRKHAVAFLEEAAKRLDDEKLTPQLDEAIKHYKIVSRNLDVVAKTFPFDFQNQSTMDERLKEADRREKAAKALEAARDAERDGLKALAKIAVALGAEGIDPNKVGTSPSPPGTAS